MFVKWKIIYSYNASASKHARWQKSDRSIRINYLEKNKFSNCSFWLIISINLLSYCINSLAYSESIVGRIVEDDIFYKKIKKLIMSWKRFLENSRKRTVNLLLSRGKNWLWYIFSIWQSFYCVYFVFDAWTLMFSTIRLHALQRPGSNVSWAF